VGPRALRRSEDQRGYTEKLIGGVQSVCRWARKKGFVPDDWADPFADMRVGEEESDRAPFGTNELRAIFGTPVFTQGARPVGGKATQPSGCRCLPYSQGRDAVSLRVSEFWTWLIIS
jgi:hypothetical protein